MQAALALGSVHRRMLLHGLLHLQAQARSGAGARGEAQLVQIFNGGGACENELGVRRAAHDQCMKVCPKTAFLSYCAFLFATERSAAGG